MNDENPDLDVATEAAEAAAEAVEEEAPAPKTTVREYRHEAKNVLTQARQSLSVRTETTGKVYSMLNGTIEMIVKGVQGLTQEQQVERLYDAVQQAKENREEIVALAEQARDEVVAQANKWVEEFPAALDSAIATLEEAHDFAEQRDFKAHQSKKRRAQSYGGYSSRRRSGRYSY